MGEEERDTRDARMTWHVCGDTSSKLPDLAEMTAVDVKRRLALLFEERALAKTVGLADDPAYMGDLEEEISATKAAWTGAAVTEIALLRARMSGAQLG
jgi:hypothetical protein